jgi:hypothetical protein
MLCYVIGSFEVAMLGQRSAYPKIRGSIAGLMMKREFFSPVLLPIGLSLVYHGVGSSEFFI